MIPKMARLLDWDGPLPEVGHYLQTRSGSTYAIIGVKPNTRTHPKSKARLDLLKFSPEDCHIVPSDAIIHTFYWASR